MSGIIDELLDDLLQEPAASHDELSDIIRKLETSHPEIAVDLKQIQRIAPQLTTTALELQQYWLHLRLLNKVQKLSRNGALIGALSAVEALTLQQEISDNFNCCLQAMLLQMPVELQPLKILMLHGEYEAAERAIHQYVIIDARKPMIESEFIAFIKEFLTEVDSINKKHAKQSLTAMSNFTALEPEIQQILIQQHAYVSMLQAYKSNRGEQAFDLQLDKELEDAASLLEANIKAALEAQADNAAVISKLHADYQSIMERMTAREQEVREQKRWDNIRMPVAIIYRLMTSPSDQKSSPVTTALLASDLLSTAYVGYRNGWFPMLGAGLLNLGVKQAILASYDADRMQFPQFDAEREFARSMEDTDYAFLCEQDAFWKIDATKPHVMTIPLRQVIAQRGFKPTESLANTVTTAAKENFAQQIQQGEDLVNTAVEYQKLTKSIAVDAGITAAGLVIIVMAILFPALLYLGYAPVGILFFAALVPAVAVGVLGLAGIVTSRLYYEPGTKEMQRVDKVVEWAYTPIDWIVRLRDFISAPFTPKEPNIVADIKAKHTKPAEKFCFDAAGMERLKAQNPQLHAITEQLQEDFRLYETELLADLKKLAGTRTHQAEEQSVAQDLHDRVESLQQFYNMLNEKLKSEDPLQSQTLKEIYALYLQCRAVFVRPRFIVAAQAHKAEPISSTLFTSATTLPSEPIQPILTFTASRDSRPSFALPISPPRGKPEYAEMLQLRAIKARLDTI